MTFYGSQAGKWQPYSTSSPCPNGDRTGCHEDHVHLSFTWAGAYGRTSYWTGKVAKDDYGPCRPDGMSWAPQYTAFNPTPCPYAAPPAAVPSSPAYLRGLRQWSGIRLDTTWDSPAVVPVQQRLGVPATGNFDAGTQAALEAFQRAHGLTATGVTDVATWRALLTPPAAAIAPSGSASPHIAGPVLAGADVFGRSAGGKVVRYTRSGGALSATADILGGQTESNPAAAPYGADTAVAFRGQNNAVYLRTGAPGSWSGWRKVGGKTWWAPALATDAAGRLHVFFTGVADHAVWTRTLDAGSWSKWSKVGGTSANPPAATPVGTGIYLAVTGTDGIVRASLRGDAGWGAWRGFGGSTGSGPAIAYDPASGSRVFVIRGRDSQVHVRTLTQGWRAIGGTTHDNPSVAVDGRQQFTVAITDTSDEYSSSTGFTSWSAWQRG
jgi:peptidoglycan hydrolase-like protein with peptidoglycan-binding domain